METTNKKKMKALKNKADSETETTLRVGVEPEIETTSKAEPASKTEAAPKTVGRDFFDDQWKESWTYIKTVVDVLREPILILDKNLTVKAANEPFYLAFKTLRENTENKNIYSLGNGQWDIPTLRKLLEDILPKHTFFNGFEVVHDFPKIGRKVMILNARQIYSDDGKALFPPIILLAMEDVTGMMDVAEKLARHTNDFETELKGRTQSFEDEISALKREIGTLKKKS